MTLASEKDGQTRPRMDDAGTAPVCDWNSLQRTLFKVALGSTPDVRAVAAGWPRIQTPGARSAPRHGGSRPWSSPIHDRCRSHTGLPSNVPTVPPSAPETNPAVRFSPCTHRLICKSHQKVLHRPVEPAAKTGRWPTDLNAHLATVPSNDWLEIPVADQPHQALGMKTPAPTNALAARPEQQPLGH